MVPRYFELISWRSQLSDLSGMPFLEIAQPHLSTWDQLMKRIFDIFVSGLILLITSPLLLAVAIGVKLSSPGPVFFRQVRLGRHGQPFTVNKFRSMTVETRRRTTRPRSRRRCAVASGLVDGDGHGNGNGNGNGNELATERQRPHPRRRRRGGELEIDRYMALTAPCTSCGQGGPDQPHHPLRRLPAQDRASTRSPSSSTSSREICRWSDPTVHPGRIPGRGLGDPALRSPPWHHRSVAGLWSQRPFPHRPDPTRLPLRQLVVTLVGSQDHVRDPQDHGPRYRRLLRTT